MTKIISKIVFILIFLSLTYSQDNQYLAVAEKMPEIKGGIKAIYEDITYPKMARDNGIEGKVYVLAFINEKGTVDKVQVVRGIGAGCDEAAADAIKKAEFTPAQMKGNIVKVKMALAIVFKIR